MKRLRRLALCVVLGVSSAGTAYAGMPVSVVADIPATLNQTQIMAQWTSQLASMKNQLDQLKSQYSSMTGSRNLGQIFDDPSLRNYLPDNWRSVYDQVKSGGYGGLSGNASSIYNSNKIFDACAIIKDATAQGVCQSNAVKGAQDQATVMDAYATAERRLNQLNQLRQQISQTQDPKAIAELNARIGTEEAAIQNEQTKLQLYKMVSDAQDKINQQRAQEAQARTWAATGSTSIQPLTFN